MAQSTTKTTTLEYLETIELGAIVAFKTEIKGITRTLSGKLIDRILGGEKIAVIETKNGSIFDIDFNDVIWVKTGERWPRWVFDELKKK